METLRARGTVEALGSADAWPESSGAQVARLLDLDPDLGYALSVPDLCRASREVLVRVEAFGLGRWDSQLADALGGAGLGVLVVDGLLVKQNESAGRVSAELIGAGDVIYPWDAQRSGDAERASWAALTPGRAALLDRQLFVRISAWPALSGAIASRSTRRGRVLAALALTRRMRRIDDRLLFMFALFAERWGRVRPDGVCLSLPVTHEILGRVVGARRQAVTTALAGLRARGLITALPGREWLLTGPPDAAAMLAYARTLPR